MAKYIRKCYKCNKTFAQEVDPKNFKVSCCCEECKKKIKITYLS